MKKLTPFLGPSSPPLPAAPRAEGAVLGESSRGGGGGAGPGVCGWFGCQQLLLPEEDEAAMLPAVRADYLAPWLSVLAARAPALEPEPASHVQRFPAKGLPTTSSPCYS